VAREQPPHAGLKERPDPRSSVDAILNSTTLHNVFLPGAGTGGKTCQCRAMMATSDTVRRFRLPVPGCRFPPSRPLPSRSLVPGPWSRRCLYDRVPYSTPVPGCRFPVPAVAFITVLRIPPPVPGPRSRLGLYDRVPYSTPVAGCRFPVPAVAFMTVGGNADASGSPLNSPSELGG